MPEVSLCWLRLANGLLMPLAAHRGQFGEACCDTAMPLSETTLRDTSSGIIPTTDSQHEGTVDDVHYPAALDQAWLSFRNIVWMKAVAGVD